jgi:hypothetical protein
LASSSAHASEQYDLAHQSIPTVTRKSPSASGSAKTRKSEALIAMERGEVEGFCAMGWNELKQRHTPWVTEKKVNILFQRGLDKDEELPNVPLISDYAKSPIDRSVFELLLTPLEMGRPL